MMFFALYYCGQVDGAYLTLSEYVCIWMYQECFC